MNDATANTNGGAGATMTGRERLRAVLAGEIPDRIPTSTWLHNFAREADADSLVNETLRLQNAFGFDFIKPQSPARAACSLWGAETTIGQRADDWPELTRPGLRGAADLDEITPRKVEGQLADQLEVMARVRTALGPDVPVVGTVFTPLMVMWLMHEDGKAATLSLMRDEPERMTRALDNIAATLCDFTKGLIEAGVDGVFYATTTCNRGEMTDAEHDRFHAPYDKAIIDASGAGWMNILHLCGPEVEVDRFVDYDMPIFSWELGSGNPGLSEMYERTGKVVLSGVPGKPRFGTVDVDEMRRGVQAAVAEMEGRRLIIGPGCSINPGVADERIGQIVEEVRRIRPGQA